MLEQIIWSHPWIEHKFVHKVTKSYKFSAFIRTVMLETFFNVHRSVVVWFGFTTYENTATTLCRQKEIDYLRTVLDLESHPCSLGVISMADWVCVTGADVAEIEVEGNAVGVFDGRGWSKDWGRLQMRRNQQKQVFTNETQRRCPC